MNLRSDWMTNSELFGVDYDKDLQIQQAIERFNIQRYQSNEGRSCEIDGEVEQIAFQIHVNPLNDGKETVKIICDADCNIHTGSIVSLDGGTFIVVSPIYDAVAYKVASIVECNNRLKFYKNATLYSIPCIFKNTILYEKSTEIINISLGTYTVLIPAGTITKADLNLRFILNNGAYKIIGISDAVNGLIKIELTDDNFTANDNISLSVADWLSNQVVNEINILNGTSVRKFFADAPWQISVECKQNNVVVSNPSVIYTSSNSLICTVSNTGLVTMVGTGTAIVTASYNGVTDTIEVVSDIDSEVVYNVVLTPFDSTLKSNRSITFTGMITNNGVNESYQNVSFIVSNTDGSSNNYVTYTENMNTLTITAGAVYNKYITIRAYMDAYPQVYIEKQLKIISLI